MLAGGALKLRSVRVRVYVYVYTCTCIRNVRRSSTTWPQRARGRGSLVHGGVEAKNKQEDKSSHE